MKHTPSGVRFAPSPTGPFHVGNLRTAWVSYELAKRLGQPWVVRFEDIDGPRVVAGARESQLADLAALGLVPTEILLQTDRTARHWGLFTTAVEAGAVYPCFCSRAEVQREVAGLASAPHAPEPVYTGRCRNSAPPSTVRNPTVGWRFRDTDESGREDFLVARTKSFPLALRGSPEENGFQPAYHWACALDDADGEYALLVRAADLRPAARPQRALQRYFAQLEGRAFNPAYLFHTAFVTADDGTRIEKRTRGVTLGDLAARGVAPSDLLAAMKRTLSVEGFALAPPWFDGDRMGGEARVTIPLVELGLRLT